MELFGVQELPSSKSTSAPGWAYLPGTTGNAGAASQSTSRKRTVRKQPVGGLSDHTAKQDAKILRDLAALDKESYRDVQIPVPIRHRDNAGRVSHGKVTPAVRKILQSQKTFANHLSDAEALAALAATNPQSHAQPSLGIASAPSASAAARGSPAPATAPPKRSHKKKDGAVSAVAGAAATPLRRVSAAGELLAPVKAERPDVVMAEVPTLAEPDPGFKPHPGDRDPLLKSRVPAMPGREEVAALVTAPALTYLEARARGEEGAGAGTGPPRRFCEMCGYWGRVRCTKCGTRVCALECLRSHQEECYTRYGA